MEPTQKQINRTQYMKDRERCSALLLNGTCILLAISALSTAYNLYSGSVDAKEAPIGAPTLMIQSEPAQPQ